MKVYGKIIRKSVPTTPTKEIYYIFEDTPKNMRKMNRQMRRTDKTIIFVGMLIASSILTLSNQLAKNKKGEQDE